MREIPQASHLRSAAVSVGLLCASLASLAGGGLLAVQYHGVLRAVLGGGGFAGYVVLFARALDRLGFPRSGAS